MAFINYFVVGINYWCYSISGSDKLSLITDLNIPVLKTGIKVGIGFNIGIEGENTFVGLEPVIKIKYESPK